MYYKVNIETEELSEIYYLPNSSIIRDINYNGYCYYNDGFNNFLIFKNLDDVYNHVNFFNYILIHIKDKNFNASVWKFWELFIEHLGFNPINRIKNFEELYSKNIENVFTYMFNSVINLYNIRFDLIKYESNAELKNWLLDDHFKFTKKDIVFCDKLPDNNEWCYHGDSLIMNIKTG